MIDGKERLTVREAARFLKVGVSRVYQLIEEERVMAHRASEGQTRLTITAESLVRYVGHRTWWKSLHGQK